LVRHGRTANSARARKRKGMGSIQDNEGTGSKQLESMRKEQRALMAEEPTVGRINLVGANEFTGVLHPVVVNTRPKLQGEGKYLITGIVAGNTTGQGGLTGNSSKG